MCWPEVFAGTLRIADCMSSVMVMPTEQCSHRDGLLLLRVRDHARRVEIDRDQAAVCSRRGAPGRPQAVQ
jgi:hypothetical protein